REVGGGGRGGADVAAGQLEGGRAETQVEVVVDGQWWTEAVAPQLQPQLLGGGREVDDAVEAAGERLVDVGAQVRREDCEAGEGLPALQEARALDASGGGVGVAD